MEYFVEYYTDYFTEYYVEYHKKLCDKAQPIESYNSFIFKIKDDLKA